MTFGGRSLDFFGGKSCWKRLFWKRSLVRSGWFGDLTRTLEETSYDWRLDPRLLEKVSPKKLVSAPGSELGTFLLKVVGAPGLGLCSADVVGDPCSEVVCSAAKLRPSYLCHAGLALKSDLGECLTRATHKSAPQNCATRLRALQECPTRVSCKRVHKAVPHQCPQKCRVRVLRKTVPQECPIRVSDKSSPSVLQEHESGPEECPKRLCHKSVLQECPTRVFSRSVP